MTQSTLKVLLASAAVASLCAVAPAFAQGGGNGNGGGSGGSHGAATAGMTYHSEPVNSPWNPEPSRSSTNPGPGMTHSQGMAPTNDMPAPAAQ